MSVRGTQVISRATSSNNFLYQTLDTLKLKYKNNNLNNPILCEKYYFAGHLNVPEFFNTKNSNMSCGNSCALTFANMISISYEN